MNFIRYKGRRMCVAAWAREYGLERATLQARLNVGWGIELALTTPVPPRMAKQATNQHSIVSAEMKARMAKSYGALAEHLQREVRTFVDSFKAAASLQAEQAAKDMANIYSPGVVGNSQQDAGTGGGSTTRESAELEFSRSKVAKP